MIFTLTPQLKTRVYALISIIALVACLPLHFSVETVLSIHKSPNALFELLTYYPNWLEQSPYTFKSFITYVLICILFYIGWLIIEEKEARSKLLYIARAVVRYRLAAAMFAMGIIKLIPIQLPPPTLSDLHTNYGDFLPWKIYYLTNSAALFHHQSYLGFIELLAASALLFRKTASIGAGLALAFLTNVILVNIAYQLNHTLLAIYLFSLAAFVIIYDIPRLFSFFFGKRKVYAAQYKPLWRTKGLSSTRYILKTGFLFVTIFFLFQVYYIKQSSPFPFFANAGLIGKSGFYQVDTFTINGKTIPATRRSEQGWQDVVFEAWNTISIADNKVKQVTILPPKGVALFDNSRYYEYAGSGGRSFYTYTVDTLTKELKLQAANGGNRTFHLHYESPADSILVLTGTNEQQDSIRAKLIKKERKYLIYEGRRKPIKI